MPRHGVLVVAANVWDGEGGGSVPRGFYGMRDQKWPSDPERLACATLAHRRPTCPRQTTVIQSTPHIEYKRLRCAQC